MARFEVPDGWVAQAYRFALDATPAQGRALVSHAGAARCAFNHMLDVVRKNLDQRAAERSYGLADAELTAVQGWSLPALRKTWNQHKRHVAPWWAANSKEAYNTGLDALSRALDAWSKSRKGQRDGQAVGFPRFKSLARSRPTVRFTTGTIRVEPDRHHVTLPKLGTIKTHESTRKLARRLDAGTARILSATVTRDASGRWYCAFAVIVQRAPQRAAWSTMVSRHPVVGVDVGVKDLCVAATPEGVEVARVVAPKPLGTALAGLRRLQRKAARRHGPYDPAARARRAPSKRWCRTQGRIGKMHVRVANVRRDVLHKATTALAQRHDTVVVETLPAAGMRAKGGARKRGLNRGLADAALAEIRRMLGYKTRWYGSILVEADRWYPSSKTCSACQAVKAKLSLAERVFACDSCGGVLDRDLNAAINLARLGDTHSVGEQGPAGSGSVAGRGATQETASAQAGNAAGDETSTPPNTPGVDQTGIAPPQGEAA